MDEEPQDPQVVMMTKTLQAEKANQHLEHTSIMVRMMLCSCQGRGIDRINVCTFLLLTDNNGPWRALRLWGSSAVPPGPVARDEGSHRWYLGLVVCT